MFGEENKLLQIGDLIERTLEKHKPINNITIEKFWNLTIGQEKLQKSISCGVLILLTIIVAILVFNAIVLIHEGGHYIAARLSGIKVVEFALGMGPSYSE